LADYFAPVFDVLNAFSTKSNNLVLSTRHQHYNETNISAEVCGDKFLIIECQEFKTKKAIKKKNFCTRQKKLRE